LCLFTPKNLPKGRNFTYLEDPGIWDLANALTQGYQQDNARYIGGVTTGGEGEFFHDFCLEDNRGKPLGQVDKTLINPPVYAAYPYPFTKDF